MVLSRGHSEAAPVDDGCWVFDGESESAFSLAFPIKNPETESWVLLGAGRPVRGDERVLSTHGQADIRGLVTAGRSVRLERCRWSRNRASHFLVGVVLPIVSEWVTPRVCRHLGRDGQRFLGLFVHDRQ